MSLAHTLGVALTGVRAQLVEIEADLGTGLPGMSFTGLADTSVVESRDRIRAALQNSGADMAESSDHRRAASGRSAQGRLALRPRRGDGSAGVQRRGVAGSRSARSCGSPSSGWTAGCARCRACCRRWRRSARPGRDVVVVSAANGAEAALVPGVDVRVAHDLREIVDWLAGDGPPLPPAAPSEHRDARRHGPDLAEVAGQALAKRAVEVAAAGGHHVYLVGAPGAGKTMLAERLPGLLPPLDDAASLEVTAVHSVAGRLGERAQLIRQPPWQAPHHTASVASLVGGGSHLGRPGAISLAHRGVLFLDEAPEFPPRALDALRQPLESGLVVLHRAAGVVTLPGPVPARPRREPVPVRQQGARVCVPAAGAAPLPAAAVRAAARSHRRARACRRRCRMRSCSTSPRIASRPRWWPLGSRRPVRRLRSGGPRRRGGATARSRVRRCARCRGRCRGRCWRRRRPTCSAASSARVASTGCCGWPGRWPTWPGTPARLPSDVAEALFFRTGRSEGWAA